MIPALKESLVEKGASPVFYVARTPETVTTFDNSLERYTSAWKNMDEDRQKRAEKERRLELSDNELPTEPDGDGPGSSGRYVQHRHRTSPVRPNGTVSTGTRSTIWTSGHVGRMTARPHCGRVSDLGTAERSDPAAIAS